MFSGSGLSPKNSDRIFIGRVRLDLISGATPTSGTDGLEYCDAGPFHTHLRLEEADGVLQDVGHAGSCPNERANDRGQRWRNAVHLRGKAGAETRIDRLTVLR